VSTTQFIFIDYLYETSSLTIMTNTQKLEQLQNKLLVDNPCPELAAQAKQLVFGVGNPEAVIMFVGEAPGKKEDETGMPFVGASGKFLNEMLTLNNLNRSDTYITNIVKYRPPNNRDPLSSEKEAFWSYLVEQIAIIKPKVIATLGRHSGQAFIKSLRIGVDHGKPQQVELQNNDTSMTVNVIPLYHPAAALYNGSLRQTLLDDFVQLGKLLTTN
jgi:uracil-DNA glycosylase